jgi:hypothetical protein
MGNFVRTADTDPIPGPDRLVFKQTEPERPECNGRQNASLTETAKRLRIERRAGQILAFILEA